MIIENCRHLRITHYEFNIYEFVTLCENLFIWMYDAKNHNIILGATGIRFKSS